MTFRDVSRGIAVAMAAFLWVSCAEVQRTSLSDLVDETLDEAIQRVYPALVRLDVVSTRPDDGRMEKRRSFGSGVIIDTEGHVITNHHVAGRAVQITCRLSNGERLDATLVGTDALSDIAVVQLNLETRTKENPRSGDLRLAMAPFGDSDEVQVGDMVFAMGSPAALSQSVTRGIVSNTAMILPEMLRRSGAMNLDGEDVGYLVRWIGHDAEIFGGNSGGPLVNANGEIIGINEMGIGSLGGAIPGNLAKSIAEDIIQTGQVRRSWIGVSCQPRLTSQGQVKGVLIGNVIEDSPGQEAGLKAGDIIIAFDHQSVDCESDDDLPLFHAQVMTTPVGKTVSVMYIRNGQTQQCRLTTKLREKIRSDPEECKAWGMVVRAVTPMEALYLRRDTIAGALVTSVRPGGPCSTARPAIQAGDILIQVDHQPVDSPEQLHRVTEGLLSDNSDKVSVAVEFVRQSDRYLSAVRIGHEGDDEQVPLATKAWLPVRTQVLTRELIRVLGLETRGGVRVIQVFKGHSADLAGLQVGDILLKIDDQMIRANNAGDSEYLDQMIRQYPVGTVVTLELMREGQSRTIDVELEPSEKVVSEMARYEDDVFELTVREIAFDDRVDLQMVSDIEGVFVERVQSAGWAALAGLDSGDVILSVDGTPTPTIESIKSVLKQVQEEQRPSVILFVQRGSRTVFVEIKTNWESS